MVLEQFIIDADIIWDQVGKTFFENPEAKPGRIMRVQVVNAGIIEDLTGYTLNLGWTSVRDPSKFGLDAFDDVDITKGIFEIEYTSGMLTNIGPLNASLQLVPPGEGRPVESNNFKLTVKNSAINPEAIQGETSFKALENALVEVNGWNARIDVVEQEFKDRADALDGAYPVRLTAAEQSVAAVEAQVDLLNRGLGETMPTMASLLAAYPTGDTRDHIVAGNIAEVDTLIVTAIPTSVGNVTVTSNGVAKTIAVDPAVQTTTSLLATLIRGTAFTGWVTGGTGTTVTFTSTTAGTRTVPTFTGGTTGMTASIVVTVKGENANFHRYFWNGAAWADGGAYQAIEITDKSVTPEKTTFQLIDLSSVTMESGFYINKTNGSKVSNTVEYHASSFVDLPYEDVDFILDTCTSNDYAGLAFYNAAGSYISGLTTGYSLSEMTKTEFKVPSGAKKFKFTCWGANNLPKVYLAVKSNAVSVAKSVLNAQTPSTALLSLNGIRTGASGLTISTGNGPTDTAINIHDNLSIKTLFDYGSFYDFTNTSVGKSLNPLSVQADYVDIPSSMTKYTEIDKALRVNFTENPGPAFSYEMFYLPIDSGNNEDMTFIAEVMLDRTITGMTFEAYTFTNKGDATNTAAFGMNVGGITLEANKVYNLSFKIPKNEIKDQNWLRVVLWVPTVPIAFYAYWSRMMVVKGSRNFSEIPMTQVERLLAHTINDLVTFKTIYGRATVAKNFVHNDTNWNTETNVFKSVYSANPVTPSFPTSSAKAMEISYFNPVGATGAFGYLFRYAAIPTGTTKLSIYFRGMLKDYAQSTKVVRLFIRLFKVGDAANAPTMDLQTTITMTNNVPFEDVLEFPLPINHEFVVARFGVWNTKASGTEVLVIQHEAMGLYSNSTRKDISQAPFTLADLQALSGAVPSIAKTNVADVVTPLYIYVTANDITNNPKNAREYSAALYLDHMVKTTDTSTKFAAYPDGEGDKYYFSPPVKMDGNNLYSNNNENLHVSPKTIAIQSNAYNFTDKTVTLRSIKSTLSKAKHPKVLFIGDSITAKTGSNPNYGNGEYSYWGYVQKLFALDKIDGGNVAADYNFTSLGSNNTDNITVDYKGTQKTIVAAASGIGGWTLANFLHHATGLRPTQETWDQLGLGDGSHTDYIGNATQKMTFATTNEVNAVAVPSNHFFDNAKVGAVKFSIEKWLAQYRTMDDAGVRLTLGSPGIGSLVTSENLPTMNVCTPTHVVIQHGRNDFGQVGIEPMIENYKLMIADLKLSIPNVVVIICIPPDTGGTFFRERYPQIIGDIGRIASTRTEWLGANRLIEEFGAMEASNVFLAPNYFVQPTALGYALQDISMPESLLGNAGYTQGASKRYRAVADFPDSHNGSPSHLTWAYQIYSLLKYQLSL